MEAILSQGKLACWPRDITVKDDKTKKTTIESETSTSLPRLAFKKPKHDFSEFKIKKASTTTLQPLAANIPHSCRYAHNTI